MLNRLGEHTKGGRDNPPPWCKSSTMWGRFYMLTCDWAPGLMTAGLPIFSQPWLVWYKQEYVQRKAVELWTHWSQSFCCGKKEDKITRQTVKATPHSNKGKGATLVPSTVKLLHREKGRKNQWGLGGMQAWPENDNWWEVITVLERIHFGMDKFSSKVHRVHMELGGKLLNSLWIATQFFERL